MTLTEALALARRSAYRAARAETDRNATLEALKALADDLRGAGCIPADGETSAALHRHINAAIVVLDGLLSGSTPEGRGGRTDAD